MEGKEVGEMSSTYNIFMHKIFKNIKFILIMHVGISGARYKFYLGLVKQS